MGILVSSTLMTLNDFEPPPQIKDFREFFVILGCDTHFKNELRRNG